jgi:uncharacterized protein (DUF58 family)
MAEHSHPSGSALSPSVLAAIDDLELTARIIIEGLRTGGNRSPFHGFTTEFRQHRPYRAGDDLKYLDWKLFARSDRLYTRQFRETTNLSVMIVLDTSASMAFPEHALSKFRYATMLAASLAYLVSEQGNAVGLMTMSGGKLAYVPARGGRQHLLSLIARIDRLTPDGTFDAARVISRGAQLLQRRGVVIVISDFYDAEEATQRELRHIVQHGHDVAMLQLMSPEELTLQYTGQVELEDLESGERRLTDASVVAADYRIAVRSFLDRCRVQALRAGIDYALIATDTPPEQALRDFLRQRGNRAAVGSAPRPVAR